jgi:hypothetical protein
MLLLMALQFQIASARHIANKFAKPLEHPNEFGCPTFIGLAISNCKSLVPNYKFVRYFIEVTKPVML